MPPSFLAVGVLSIYGLRTLRWLIRERARVRALSKPYWPTLFIEAGAILVVCLIMPTVVKNAETPVIGHDALIYLGEALEFAKERKLSATTTFRDNEDGTIRGDIHNFVFPAFLSHALLTTDSSRLGYPHDVTARVAFQSTLIYMLLAVLALAGTFRYPGVGSLSLLLLLQVPQFEYISIACSRDGFRIIPLVLFVVVLIGLSGRSVYRKVKSAWIVPPMLLAAFSLSGHTLGGIVVILITVIWVGWNILFRGASLKLVIVAGAIFVGLAVSGYHYLWAYLDTGQLYGHVFTGHAIKGTPLEEIALQQQRYGSALEGGAIKALGTVLARDGYRLSIPGLIGALVAVVVSLRPNRRRWIKTNGFLGLTVLVGLVPMTGVLDYQGYSLSAAFAANLRYALHWYAFGAVCVAFILLNLYDNCLHSEQKLFRKLGKIGLLILVCLISFSAAIAIKSKWRKASWDEDRLSEQIRPLQMALERIPPGKKLVLDDSRYNYYLGNKAVIIYSDAAQSIIKAASEQEVESALKRLNVGAIALRTEKISEYWDRIALFRFLNDPRLAFELSGSTKLRIFIVDPALVEKYRRGSSACGGHLLRRVAAVSGDG
jgi:hypothetical protein